jgi:hypothetical protein
MRVHVKFATIALDFISENGLEKKRIRNFFETQILMLAIGEILVKA